MYMLSYDQRGIYRHDIQLSILTRCYAGKQWYAFDVCFTSLTSYLVYQTLQIIH